jgi:hypothetical protein
MVIFYRIDTHSLGSLHYFDVESALMMDIHNTSIEHSSSCTSGGISRDLRPILSLEIGPLCMWRIL